MATKSRKKPPKAKLKGGVGEAPAGRGGFADQLFQARETGKAGSGRNMTEYDALPEPDPNPENRFIEDFQTVEDDLRKTMASNRNDPAKVATFKSMADSMTAMMDELPRETDPDMRTRMAQAAQAYQNAWQSQSPDQQAHILSYVPPERQAEVAKFYGRDAVVDFNQGGQINLPFMDRQSAEGDQALRAARATALDFAADEEDYLSRGGIDGRRPYDRTERGQAQVGMLANLIGEGVDPEEIALAQLGDAALPPFMPGEGVYLDRGSLPARDALSSYIGGEAAGNYRPESRIDSGRVGGELLSQYRNILENRELEPVLGPLLGEKVFSPDQIQLQTPEEADITAALQMRPEIVQNQEELFRRAFGDTGLSALMDSSRGDLSAAQVQRMGGLPNIGRLAGGTNATPAWIDSMIQQVMPDGSIGYGDWTPDQVLRTIISQNEFLAESPYLREAAYQMLLPQFEQAMAAKLQSRPAPPSTRYDRNAAGRGLLMEEGGNLNSVQPSQVPRPAGPTPEQLREAIQKSLQNRRMPGQNDMGFSEPMSLPPYMASAMPNRLLSSLIG